MPRAASAKEMQNALCDLLLPMRMLRCGIFPAPFRNAAQPWYLQAPVHPALQCKPAPAQHCSSSLRLPGASEWEVRHSGAGQFPGSAFLVPEAAPAAQWLPLKAGARLEPGNWAHEFPICLNVCLQWETAVIGTECFCRDRDDLSPLPWPFWHWDVQSLVSTERGTH